MNITGPQTYSKKNWEKRDDKKIESKLKKEPIDTGSCMLLESLKNG